MRPLRPIAPPRPRPTHALAAALAITACGTASAQPSATPPSPTIPLFDGATLAGWEAAGKGAGRYWRVEDGAITGEIPAGERLGRNLFLFWKGDNGGDGELAKRRSVICPRR